MPGEGAPGPPPRASVAPQEPDAHEEALRTLRAELAKAEAKIEEVEASIKEDKEALKGLSAAEQVEYAKAVGIAAREQTRDTLEKRVSKIEDKIDRLTSPAVAAAPAVFCIEAEFPRGVQTSRGGRALVYQQMAHHGALRIGGVPYIWYGKAPPDSPPVSEGEANENAPLHVKVFSISLERSMELEKIFKDWKFMFSHFAPPINVVRRPHVLGRGQELCPALLEDYDPAECDLSLCKGAEELSSRSGGVLSGFTIVEPDSALAEFQAVDRAGAFLTHERAHLISKSIVGDPSLADELDDAFWTLANERFDITMAEVKKLLEKYGDDLNTNDSNFVAVTRRFHSAFDGLSGHQVSIAGSKRRKIAMGNVAVLLIPSSVREGNPNAGAAKDRRSVVDVVIEFLTDSARDELIDTIVSTESQPVVAHGFEKGRQRVKKEFRVYDAELFVRALRFKAALNYACWSAQHRGTAAVPEGLFKE